MYEMLSPGKIIFLKGRLPAWLLILFFSFQCQKIPEWFIHKHCVCAESLQSCPTLCNPIDCRPSGPSVHGILQARILGWVTMPSSRRSSQPRDQTCISCIFCNGRWILYHQLHLGSPNETTFCWVREVFLCLMAFRLKHWLILGLEPASLQTGTIPLVLQRLQVAESLCRAWDWLSSINCTSQYLIINYNEEEYEI